MLFPRIFFAEVVLSSGDQDILKLAHVRLYLCKSSIRRKVSLYGQVDKF